jgi:NodT family efflux transporter outer membrane factor (OMF) lipoprotein
MRFCAFGLGLVLLGGCTPQVALKKKSDELPVAFQGGEGTTSAAAVNWKDFFHDQNLVRLVDAALKNNQELNIFLQELEIAKNEAYARSGAYLPFIDLGGGAGLDKTGRFTRSGALEATTEVRPGKEFPEPLKNFSFGAKATWEVDIWRRLRNAQKSAVMKFLASQEGRNFLLTNLVSEVADSYYELRSLDSQLEIVEQNVKIQTDALEMVKAQQQAARVTELAVRRFEAQVYKTQSLQYELKQKIVEAENKINFLVGRFPQSVDRGGDAFVSLVPEVVKAGIPSQMLENRPDIRKAELDVKAAELDVKVARAAFYPSLKLSGEVGYEAYRLQNTFDSPQSLFYNLLGNLTGPLINRRAITADFYSANAKQVQAIFNYERAVLNAFIDVTNQISNVKNLEQNNVLKAKQVTALTDSIGILNLLFNSARADYTEVLITQRDALESKFELIEVKKRQLQAFVSLYRALGGGWV